MYDIIFDSNRHCCRNVHTTSLKKQYSVHDMSSRQSVKTQVENLYFQFQVSALSGSLAMCPLLYNVTLVRFTVQTLNRLCYINQLCICCTVGLRCDYKRLQDIWDGWTTSAINWRYCTLMCAHCTLTTGTVHASRVLSSVTNNRLEKCSQSYSRNTQHQHCKQHYHL